MSALLAIAIITGSVSACISTATVASLRYAKWIREKEIEDEKAERAAEEALILAEKLEKDAPERAAAARLEKERAARAAVEKRIEDEKKHAALLQKRKEIIEKLTQEIASGHALTAETSTCPFCARKSGILRFDNATKKYDVLSGSMETGHAMWNRYVDACTKSETSEGLATFLAERAAEKERRSGPSSPLAIRHNDEILMWQICVSCGAQWHYKPNHLAEEKASKKKK